MSSIWHSGGQPQPSGPPKPSVVASSFNGIALLCGIGASAVLAPMLYYTAMNLGLRALLIAQWGNGTFMFGAMKVLMGFVAFGLTVLVVRLAIVGTFLGGATAIAKARGN